MSYEDIIKNARSEGRSTLSELESRQILRDSGIPVCPEIYVKNIEQLKESLSKIEYPVVLKGNSRHIAHKTEKNLVRLYIKNESELMAEFESIMSVKGVEGVLISPQIADRREFLLGIKYDQQFGYVVVFGLGGIFTEALKDISMRVCPVTSRDIEEMIYEVRSSKLLGKIRGFEEINREQLINCILNLSKIPEKVEGISEIDINPVMFLKGNPVAVDALIVLKI